MNDDDAMTFSYWDDTEAAETYRREMWADQRGVIDLGPSGCLHYLRGQKCYGADAVACSHPQLGRVLDHLRIWQRSDGERFGLGHSYGLGTRELKDLLDLCEEFNLYVKIGNFGGMNWYSADTVAVYVQPRETR